MRASTGTGHNENLVALRMSNGSRCLRPWYDGRGWQELAVENLAIKPHTRARLQPYIKRLVQEPAENVL
jgi:hypothetical protein